MHPTEHIISMINALSVDRINTVAPYIIHYTLHVLKMRMEFLILQPLL